ncbi:hypothetical protein FHX73_1855 [Kitasatospora viridis]|uniref:Uncharacterized protein n=1 Tax=Kitasatospora viridis TaxID=281105 RepID=A0A561SA50_9ACTN|nr:hypothetical protein FHX73_1855 [Kitasatospora viridis]
MKEKLWPLLVSACAGLCAALCWLALTAWFVPYVIYGGN